MILLFIQFGGAFCLTGYFLPLLRCLLAEIESPPHGFRAKGVYTRYHLHLSLILLNADQTWILTHRTMSLHCFWHTAHESGLHPFSHTAHKAFTLRLPDSGSKATFHPCLPGYPFSRWDILSDGAADVLLFLKTFSNASIIADSWKFVKKKHIRSNRFQIAKLQQTASICTVLYKSRLSLLSKNSFSPIVTIPFSSLFSMILSLTTIL